MTLRYSEHLRLGRGHVGGVAAIAFSYLGTYIATAGLNDCMLYLWRIADGKLLHTIKCSTAILCFEWLPNREDILLFGTRGGVVCSVTLGPKVLCSRGFWAHAYPVEHLAMRGRYLVSGASCEVVVWRMGPDGDWEHVKDLPLPPASSLNEDSEVLVTGIQWVTSPKGKSLLVVTYMFHGVRIFDPKNWEPLRTIPLPGLLWAVTAFAFSSSSLMPLHLLVLRGNSDVSEDGRRIVVSNMTCGFDMYDLITQVSLRSFRHDASDGIRAVPVSFAHGGHAILGGSTVGKAKLWDADNGRVHQTFSLGPREKIMSIATNYNPHNDCFLLAAGVVDGSQNARTTIWLARSGLRTRTWPRYLLRFIAGLAATLVAYSILYRGRMDHPAADALPVD
ncbi:WD40 repeat-like protein [Trametes cingulata]|nr:WD40 repeat-like protein [Trametes cingulata]